MDKKELITELGFWAQDDIVPGELQSLLKLAVKALKETESKHTPAPWVFPHVTRVTVVDNTGVAFEQYNLYADGAELHQQDDGRTLKLFPKQY